MGIFVTDFIPMSRRPQGHLCALRGRHFARDRAGVRAGWGLVPGGGWDPAVFS